uniref:Glycosyltransferase n=1 Tax=viral metagenome TaxID=1070528 RepID=A0A6C0KQC1_9ZZZZ
MENNVSNSDYFIDKIDAILYINLEHRIDRKEHCLNEIKKIDPTLQKTHRMDAVYSKENGAMGCSLSHIKAIQYFLEHPAWKTCLILEDDFTFLSNDSIKINNLLINTYMNIPDFDVLLLAVGNTDLKIINTTFPHIKKVISSQTASGYVFTREYASILLVNYMNGVNDMKQNGRMHSNCLDQYWKCLMPLANWYTIYPRIAYQYGNYSDIERRHVSYEC